MRLLVLGVMAMSLGGCGVTAVVGAAATVVGTAVDVTGSVVSGTVDVVSSGVSGAIDLATSDAEAAASNADSTAVTTENLPPAIANSDLPASAPSVSFQGTALP